MAEPTLFTMDGDEALLRPFHVECPLVNPDGSEIEGTKTVVEYNAWEIVRAWAQIKAEGIERNDDRYPYALRTKLAKQGNDGFAAPQLPMALRIEDHAFQTWNEQKKTSSDEPVSAEADSSSP